MSPAVRKPFPLYIAGYIEGEYGSGHLGPSLLMGDRNTHSTYVFRGSEIREASGGSCDGERACLSAHVQRQQVGEAGCPEISVSQGSGGTHVRPLWL